MAETLAAGTQLVDTLGAPLKVDVKAQWQPDDTFFALLKDRETISTMLADVIGETAARSYLVETGPKQKAIIKKALAGDGRVTIEGWTPRYMTFPQRAYTTRPVQRPAPICAQALQRSSKPEQAHPCGFQGSACTGAVANLSFKR